MAENGVDPDEFDEVNDVSSVNTFIGDSNHEANSIEFDGNGLLVQYDESARPQAEIDSAERGTKIDNNFEEFRIRLEQVLGVEIIKRFIHLIQKTKSLIAGGSLLNALHGEHLRNSEYRPSRKAWGFEFIEHERGYPDIDIYVPIEHSKEFLDEFIFGRSNNNILIKSKTRQRSYKASLYCNSFLQRNGIQQIYNFEYMWKIDDDPEFCNNRNCLQSFDIMIVRNRTTPLNVVNNFDLTFCQIWFNGWSVYASHPDDVLEKKGTLQGDYVGLFLQGNTFLRHRLGKYSKRGYTIKLEQEQVQKFDGAINYSYQCLRPADEELYRHWTSRVLLWWFCGVRNNIIRHTQPFPAGFTHHDILIVPLLTYKLHSAVNVYDMIPGAKLGDVKISGPNRLETNEADGYDSEDYDENSTLYNMAYRNVFSLRHGIELASVQDSDRNDLNVLAFHRSANRLLEGTLWPNEYTTRFKEKTRRRGFVYKDTLGKILDKKAEIDKMPVDNPKREWGQRRMARIPIYYEKLKERCVRRSAYTFTMPPSNGQNILNDVADDMYEVFDLHHHPLIAGIASDEMEQHLSQFMLARDKTKLKCYWQPEDPTHGDDHKNCKEFLMLSQIKMVVSPAFYAKFTKPSPVKRGLDQFISVYDTALSNSKVADPSWGELYSDTLCPFCLEPVNREEGCAYMTHKKEREDEESPFCDSKVQIISIFDKYSEAAKALLADSPHGVHIEFCVECGRPCSNHQHLTTQAPYTFVPTPQDAEGQFQYGVCTGGGRAELFARILAIRKVYRERRGRISTLAERRMAAEAADAAPLNEELMAQGRAILEMEEKAWPNGAIPEKKLYTNEAYWVPPPPGQVAAWRWGPNDGAARRYYRSADNGIWRIERDEGVGDWIGVYDPDTNEINDAPEPDMEDIMVQEEEEEAAAEAEEAAAEAAAEAAEPVVNERQRERERIRQAAEAIDVQTVDFHQVPWDVLVRLSVRMARDAPQREDEFDEEYMWRIQQADKDAHLAVAVPFDAPLEENNNHGIENAPGPEEQQGGRSRRSHRTQKRRSTLRGVKTIKRLYHKLK